jgi:hypothetical protein
MVRLQNEDSLDRYIAYLQRFACYLLRVYAAQKKQEAHESDESDSTDDDSIYDNEDDFTSDVESNAGSASQDTANRAEIDVMKDCCELTKFNLE